MGGGAEQILTRGQSDSDLRRLGIISRSVKKAIGRNEVGMDAVLRSDGALRSGPPPVTDYQRKKERAAWLDMSMNGPSSPTPSSLMERQIMRARYSGPAMVSRVEGTVASPQRQSTRWSLKSASSPSEEPRLRGSMSNDTRTFDMKRSAEMDVFDFMTAVGQDTPTSPAIPPNDVIELRLALIEEEYGELIAGIASDNLVEIADACVDLCVVVIGTAIAYGIPFSDVWDEVHDTNMAKISGPVAPNGKRLKPEGWTPPNIVRILLDAASQSLKED